MSEERLRSLLVLGLAGDEVAYRAYLREMTAHLRSFLRRRLRGLPEDVEDLLQELLLALHNQRHTYDPAQPLTAWVHAIARYKIVDHLRRRSRSEALNEPFDDGEPFAGADHDAAEARYDVATLLRELPDRQRQLIEYVKIGGASVAEAARLTGMSESAVKVGIHRGLRKLATRMRGVR